MSIEECMRGYVSEDRSGLPDWIVVCKGDDGELELATRTVFQEREAARLYASTIADSRGAMVVRATKLGRLRFDDERGTLDYWWKLGVR